jgi:hypothetical protein
MMHADKGGRLAKHEHDIGLEATWSAASAKHDLALFDGS